MQKGAHTTLNILFKHNTENTKYYILFNVKDIKEFFVTDVVITYIILRQICFSLD